MLVVFVILEGDKVTIGSVEESQSFVCSQPDIPVCVFGETSYIISGQAHRIIRFVSEVFTLLSFSERMLKPPLTWPIYKFPPPPSNTVHVCSSGKPGIVFLL